MGNKSSGNLRVEQAAATRQKLLESAQKLFAENGYQGTPVRAINRNADLADGLLYHYFPGGKKEIFQAVVEKNVKQILDSMDPWARIDYYTSIPLETVLEEIYQGFVKTIGEHLDIMRILFRENEVRDFVTKEDMMRLVGNRDSWFEDILKNKKEAGEVRDMDFSAAAFMLTSILINHVIMKIFGTECSILERKDSRQRLIAYQVHMWKK